MRDWNEEADMKRSFFLAFALASATLLPANVARGANGCPALATQQSVRRYIIASEEAWAKSVEIRDTSVPKRILADDFVWVFNDKLRDKNSAVQAAASGGNGDFLTNNADYVHVRFFGKNTAVAQGMETWTKKGGRRGKFVWTDTWFKRGGCWQIVNAHDTVVELPPQ